MQMYRFFSLCLLVSLCFNSKIGFPPSDHRFGNSSLFILKLLTPPLPLPYKGGEFKIGNPVVGFFEINTRSEL